MKLLLKQETIAIPEECTTELKNKKLTIKANNKTRILDLSHFTLTIQLSKENITVSLWNGNSKEQSKVNTCASIIKNAINGVMFGYSYILKAASIHFPIALEVHENGKTVLVKNFLGEKNIRKYQVNGDAIAKLGEEKDTLVIEGICLEDVSQFAGKIVQDCRVKNYDPRVFLDGVYVMKKGLMVENY
ncbi:60S ribosomal protein L9 [Binucleata daphniae]